MTTLLPKYLENRFDRVLSSIGTLGAGLDQTWTVPANKIWVPIMILGRLTASAVVANRAVQIIISSGANEIGRIRANQVLPASQNARYTFGRGITDQSTVSNVALNAMPDITLIAGESINLTAVGLDAGDVFSQVSFLYNEYDLSGPT
jgi:hypothetical protein